MTTAELNVLSVILSILETLVNICLSSKHCLHSLAWLASIIASNWKQFKSNSWLTGEQKTKTIKTDPKKKQLHQKQFKNLKIIMKHLESKLGLANNDDEV